MPPDIRGKLGRRRFECPFHRVDDGLDWLRDCGTHVVRIDRCASKESGHAVASGDLRLECFR
jgi:hypothetical protein